jgi:glycosyltransferase involved in cell wall biosynthesis
MNISTNAMNPVTPRKKSILIFCELYFPTIRGVGPARSVSGIANSLSAIYEVYIVASDRDPGQANSYAGISPATWNNREGVNILYLNKEQMSVKAMGLIMGERRFDLIYLNSLFSRDFTFKVLLALKLWPAGSRRVPLLLAPRGELSPQALSIKKIRKAAFLLFARASRLYTNCVYHAESDKEQEEINQQANRFLGRSRKPQILVAISPSPKVDIASIQTPAKQSGLLRICYLSRINAIKNLDYAISVLSRCSGTIQFDIYGPIGGEANDGYLHTCRTLAEQAPANLAIDFKGAVAPHQTRQIISQYHLFFLPTKTENFGHAIYEAISAGTPVLISDRTPWRNLDSHGIGWDVCLDDSSRFVDVIDNLVAMDQTGHDQLTKNIRRFLDDYYSRDVSEERLHQLFESAMSGNDHSSVTSQQNA